MRTIIVSFIAVAMVAVPANAAEDPKVAAEVMAIARAQIAASIAQKPFSERMVAATEDYTIFTPAAPTRIDGKANIMSINTANNMDGGKQLHNELLNPKVQVYGDTAILTYNSYSINQDKNGRTSPSNQKVTRVYVRQSGAWRNVHGHFSTPTPPAN